MARCFFLQKNYSRVIGRVQKAIKLAPEKAGYYFLQGTAYFKLNKYESALESYCKALSLKTENGSYYYVAGVTCSKLKQFKRAIEYLERATSYGYQNDLYQLEYARALNGLGNHETALQMVQSAIAKGDMNSNYKRLQTKILLDMGFKLQAEKDYEGAITLYRKLLKFDAESSSTYAELSWCMYQLSRYSIAKTYITKAISLQTAKGIYYWQLGAIFEAEGDIPQALSTYKKGTEMAPGFSDCWKGLAELYLEQGEIQKAANTYKAATEKATKEDWAFEASMLCAKIWEDLQEYEAAVVVLQCIVNNYGPYVPEEITDKLIVLNQKIKESFSTEKMMKKAASLVEKEAYADAAELYRKVLEYDEDNAAANAELSWCLYWQDEDSDALFYIEKAIEKDAGCGEYYWQTLKKRNLNVSKQLKSYWNVSRMKQ